MASLVKVMNRLLVAVVLGTVVVCLFFVFRRDLQESFYSSLVEAGKDGAITRGWIPDQFLPRDLRLIEILFRGITEGEFWTRCEEITLSETPTPSELRAPPFTAPGPFSGTSPSR